MAPTAVGYRQPCGRSRVSSRGPRRVERQGQRLALLSGT